MQARGTVQQLVSDVLLDFVKFPIWWYTRGLANAAAFGWRELQAAGEKLSLRILFRNLFKPMFGDYTRSGRAISIGLRIVVFFFNIFLMALWIVVLSAIVLAWPVLPIVVVVLFINAL